MQQHAPATFIWPNFAFQSPLCKQQSPIWLRCLKPLMPRASPCLFSKQGGAFCSCDRPQCTILWWKNLRNLGQEKMALDLFKAKQGTLLFCGKESLGHNAILSAATFLTTEASSSHHGKAQLQQFFKADGCQVLMGWKRMGPSRLKMTETSITIESL